MNTIRRQKVLVRPFLEVRDDDGNLVREIACQEAVLYFPHCAQLEDLLHALEVAAMDEENRLGRDTKMSNGARQVSREVTGGKRLRASEEDRAAGAGKGESPA